MFIICFLSYGAAYSQDVIYQKSVTGKIHKKFEEARNAYNHGKLEHARKLFTEIIRQTPSFIDARIQLGSVYFDLKDYQQAEKNFSEAIRLDSFYKVKIFYTLSLAQYRLDKFEEAKGNMEIFLAREIYNNDLLNKAKVLYKNILFASEAILKKETLHLKRIEAFYSNFSEYMPCVQADGNRAYFTRRSPLGDEDIYMAYKTDTNWSEPVPLEVVNSHLNEGSPSISADGNFLVFTSCDRIDRIGGCDLYYCEWNGKQWSSPRNLGEQVNTPAYESQACISNNGKTLHFVSNRKGTLGGLDIWVTHKKNDGQWSVPRNLGPPVNSTGDEVSPFLHPNGITLYFASDGHGGIGGKDLFVSKLDSTLNWTQPLNLGFPINSTGDESSWIVLPDGKTAWMASDQEYLGNSAVKPNLDLYEIVLPAALQITPSTYVKLRIYDHHTKSPVQAVIKIFNLNAQLLIETQKANESGEILFSVPTGSDYAVQVQHDLYNLFSEHFYCKEERSIFHPLLLDIGLFKIEDALKVPVALRNIFFESGSDVLLPESKFELDALCKMLKLKNHIRILIEAHTDDVGTDADNKSLSEKRARSVVAYLVDKGIAASRLQAKGHGESRPEASNETEEGRRLNRRIVFSIIE